MHEFGQRGYEVVDRPLDVEDVPPVLADQLTIGGVMVVPIGLESTLQKIVRVTRTMNGLETEELRDVNFVPLIPTEVLAKV